jgi:hypothetical protein
MTLWRSGSLLWFFCGVFGYVALLLLAISISSALYLLAELAEEYPTLAGTILKRWLLPGVVILHLILWIDGLPTLEVMLGLFSHGCYYLMLQSYPLLKLNSHEAPLALFSFCISHYFWFIYFTDPMNYNLPGRDVLHLCGFFVMLVWVVPFGLFISLSISDNVLPSGNGNMGSTDHLSRMNDPAAAGSSKGGKGSNAFKTVYDFFHHIVDEVANYSYTGAGKVKNTRHRNNNHTVSNSNNAMGGNGNHLGDDGSSASSYFSPSSAYYSTNYSQPAGQYNASQFTTNRGAVSSGAYPPPQYSKND